MKNAHAKPQSDYPEFGVEYETISGYFEPALARSTFHDRVQDGTIVPMKGMRGFYLLNESLRRLKTYAEPAESDCAACSEVSANIST